jgi:hypothetical protein
MKINAASGTMLIVTGNLEKKTITITAIHHVGGKVDKSNSKEINLWLTIQDMWLIWVSDVLKDTKRRNTSRNRSR